MPNLIIQGLNMSNINKEEMDNQDKIKKGGYFDLLFDKHNHKVVECTN